MNKPKNAEFAIEYFKQAIALGSYYAVNQLVESSGPKNSYQWTSAECIKSALAFHPSYQYRWKKESHLVNGYSVPAPYHKEPKDGTYIYYIGPDYIQPCLRTKYSSDSEFTKALFESNNCFVSEKDASENRCAMFKIGIYRES